jgi:hypothetical protein
MSADEQRDRTRDEERSEGERYPGGAEGGGEAERHGAAHGGEPEHGSDVRTGSPASGTSAQEVVEPHPAPPSVGRSLEDHPELFEAADKREQVKAGEHEGDEPEDAPPAGYDPQIAPSDAQSSAPPPPENLPGE